MSYYQDHKHEKNTDTTDNDIAHLADELVHRLGLEDALQVCQENSWDGVLHEIQDRIDAGFNH